MNPGVKDDNKTLKEQGKNIIISDLMPLLEKRLTKLEYTVVSSFLAKNMTFKELRRQITLTPNRQKQIFESSMIRIQRFFLSIDATIREFELLKKEHEKLVAKLDKIEFKDNLLWNFLMLPDMTMKMMMMVVMTVMTYFGMSLPVNL